MLSILGERERSHCLCIVNEATFPLPVPSSSAVSFTLSLNATKPGQAFLHFLNGFSSMSIPSTSLLKGTTPRQALLPLLGTLPGAMIAGTLSLQGTMSLQAFFGQKWALILLAG